MKSSYRYFQMLVKKVSIIELIYIGGLCLLPFIWWPWASIMFEIPRVWFFHRWAEVLVVLVILFRKKIHFERPINSRTFIWIALFAGITVITALLGSDLGKSLQGNYYRGDGLFTFVHLLSFFLVTYLLVTTEILRRIIFCISLSSLGLSFMALGSFLIHHGPPSEFFGNSRFLATYLVITLPCFFLWKPKLAWLGLLIQCGTILTTASLGGILGIALALSGYFVWFLKKRLDLYIILILGMVMVTIACFFLIDPRQQKSFEGRGRIFTKGYYAFMQRPITGWGMANFDHAFEAVNWPVKTETDIYVDKAHSTLVEVAVTTGVFGLMAYIFFIGALLKKAFKSKSSEDIAIAMLFILVFIMSQTNILSISSELYFWFAAAVLLI